LWFLSQQLIAAGLSNITLGRTPSHNIPPRRTYTFKQEPFWPVTGAALAEMVVEPPRVLLEEEALDDLWAV